MLTIAPILALALLASAPVETPSRPEDLVWIEGAVIVPEGLPGG